MEDLSNNDYLQVHIPYVLQKTVDFSNKPYEELVTTAGNGKLVRFIIDYFESRNVGFPMPKNIVQCIKLFCQ